ncbi:MAG TPA: 3-hydroxyacyl-CoA dehydrogenase NAD-binding domain-containing protein [Hanamia sp.]|nr:3-hydroxyacyl-CoA dehydrogenase NAD-binding domain-containing protein [Hanamia sp.]
MFYKIAVLGTGTMGLGIAQFFAQNQLVVLAYDVNSEMISKAQNRLKDQKGIYKYLSFTTNLQEAVSDADLIIESVIEDLEIKRRLYSDIESFLKKDAIISSNTSTYPLAFLAFGQSFSNRMIITHFFNPPQLVPLVELVQSEDTLQGLIEEIEEFLRHFGKVPVVLKKDSKGFIANRLQVAVLREACFLVDSGVADVRDIDRVMTEGIGLRWAFNGPFKIADLGGLDVWEKVCINLLPDLSNEKQIPELIKEKVTKGETGLKSGHGFYKYDFKNNDAENTLHELIQLLKLKEMMIKK